VIDWFGEPKDRPSVLELPDAGAAPFEAGNMMLMPITNPDRKLARITLVHGLTHASFTSPRPWVGEGLAHFMQALEREQLDGRKAALDYMGLHRAAFLAAEQPAASGKPNEPASSQPLVATFDESHYRSKAMYVWWMLRDMVGEMVLKKALQKYRADDDKDPNYVEGLVTAESKKDLSWFFEDWVYQDKGLPDFRIESAYSRKTEKGSYLVTVTVVNTGPVGAEVPFTVNFNGGEIVQRLEVRGNSKATTRVEVPGLPQQVVVNDGSVAESDLTNNTFTITSQ
jgi:aminopeptidase N